MSTEEITFEPYGKTHRLYREVLITEKLDGTNAAIIITEDGRVGAQSRNKLITPGPNTDHYGFAAWVDENEDALREALGTGRHYGEWWGGKFARNYGLDKSDMRFSLFDAEGYDSEKLKLVPGNKLRVVPVLARQMMDTHTINEVVEKLRRMGSKAVEMYPNPEGIVIKNMETGVVHKVTLENDQIPKGLARR